MANRQFALFGAGVLVVAWLALPSSTSSREHVTVARAAAAQTVDAVQPAARPALPAVTAAEPATARPFGAAPHAASELAVTHRKVSVASSPVAMQVIGLGPEEAHKHAAMLASYERARAPERERQRAAQRERHQQWKALKGSGTPIHRSQLPMSDAPGQPDRGPRGAAR